MALKLGEKFKYSERIDESQPLLYAAAAGEYFTPRHIDSNYARTLGYPDILIDGFLTMGLVSKAVVTAIEDPRLLLEFHLKYKAPVFVKDTLDVSIEVAQKTEKTITLKIDVQNQEGQKVFDSGYAVIRNSNGGPPNMD